MGWFHLNLAEYLHQQQYNEWLVNYDLNEVQALNNGLVNMHMIPHSPKG
jgi:hypothetical protein